MQQEARKYLSFKCASDCVNGRGTIHDDIQCHGKLICVATVLQCCAYFVTRLYQLWHKSYPRKKKLEIHKNLHTAALLQKLGKSDNQMAPHVFYYARSSYQSQSKLCAPRRCPTYPGSATG